MYTVGTSSCSVYNLWLKKLICYWMSEKYCSKFDTLQATDSYKLGVTQAALERDKAVRELARLKRELDQEENDREHVCILHSETRTHAQMNS